MKRIKKFISKETLRIIYNSLILPHLYYCILTWGFNHFRVFALQKKAVRCICGAKYNAHTDPLFKDLSILKIQDIFILQCLKFYHKFSHKQLPVYFNKFFKRNSDVHEYNTRNRQALRLNQFKNVTTLKCIRFHIPTLVNNMPTNVKEKIDTHSLSGFSHYTKIHLIGKYSNTCDKRNCYVCNRS